MSLTATLLLGLPIQYPRGIKRKIYGMRLLAPTMPRDLADMTNAARRDAMRQANIERVYDAIAEGARTAIDCTNATGLSHVTCWKALAQLCAEDDDGHSRVIRVEINGKHFYEVTK